MIAGAVVTDSVARWTPIEWKVVADEQVGAPHQLRKILDLESKVSEALFSLEEIEVRSRFRTYSHSHPDP